MVTAPLQEGVLWKCLFLPAGTVLAFSHNGTPHLATVTDGQVFYKGASYSPSSFVCSVAGTPRNAWRDLRVMLPGSGGFIKAEHLRPTKAQERQLQEQVAAEYHAMLRQQLGLAEAR